ncbi:MAG: DUF423 domain-containing protein [Oligoflexus sp.]
MNWTIWMIMGSIFSGLGVAFGAFGAHALKARLSPDMLAIFEVGVRYQMYHALALLGVGLLGTRVEHIGIKVTGITFVLGIIIFSGSLYALSLSGQRFLGAITPIGGVLFLVGWISLTISLFKLG